MQTVQIPVEEDRAFRTFLLWASPEPVRQMFSLVLADGPMARGAEKAADYYGADLQDVILRTVPVIDEIELFRPGFKRWLVLTGFGNDRRMIAAFHRWAEMESRGDLRQGLPERVIH